jgi:hypothetical protein
MSIIGLERPSKYMNKRHSSLILRSILSTSLDLKTTETGGNVLAIHEVYAVGTAAPGL